MQYFSQAAVVFTQINSILSRSIIILYSSLFFLAAPPLTTPRPHPPPPDVVQITVQRRLSRRFVPIKFTPIYITTETKGQVIPLTSL